MQRTIQIAIIGLTVLGTVQATAAETTGRLFPAGLPELKWTEFKARGFSQPVTGVIFRKAHPTCCGVALGGISTGALDIETSGVLGFNTIFLGFPRKVQLFLPFLGLAVGGKTWVLTTQKFLDGGVMEGCQDPAGLPRPLAKSTVPKVVGCEPVKEIEYWGHYPVADLEYETDAPVSVGLRAWAPFLPGDAAGSNIPGAVFEVHLRNTSDTPQRGTVAFSFPGPSERPVNMRSDMPFDGVVDEARSTDFTRKEVTGEFQGIAVTSLAGVGYALGVVGPENVRLGGGLTAKPDVWSKIASQLPSPMGGKADGVTIYNDPSTSVAVDFDIRPMEKRVVRFILAWYSPRWQGGTVEFLQKWFEGEGPGPYEIPGRKNESVNYYYQMYATRYRNAADVARHLAREHESLLRRVLAWQEAIYTEQRLPIWLRDCLVNTLNIIAENSYWAQPRPPLGEWAFPLGAFDFMESPRSCPVMGCLPNRWMGHLPSLYFYPELERQVLRNYKAYFRQDGAVPFLFTWADFVKPTYEWQKGLTAFAYVDSVDRLWLRTGDDTVLREFYPTVKRSVVFTMQLFNGPDFVIRMPEGNKGSSWLEVGWWAGMVTHTGAVRLSMLQSAERIARRVGDLEFAQQCREWFRLGSRSLDEKMWNEKLGSYLLYNEPETGKISEGILANQLDGDLCSFIKGIEPVFPRDRAVTVLETVKRTCMVDMGCVTLATPEGQPNVPAVPYTHPVNMVMLGMTYAYYGDPKTGLDLIHRNLKNLVLDNRYPWDYPNSVYPATGKRYGGSDYTQHMMLWALPAALEGQDLSGPAKPGGLADRVLRAAKEQQ